MVSPDELTERLGYDPVENGHVAEEHLVVVLKVLGAKIGSWPNNGGGKPGCHLAYEATNGTRQDYDAKIDGWFYMSKFYAELVGIPWGGGWIPLQLTVATQSEILGRKALVCCLKRVVLVKLNRWNLECAAKRDSNHHTQEVWEEFLNELRGWLSKPHRPFVTRAEVAALAQREVGNG